MVMGGELLTAEKEKEKAAQPKAEFRECRTGCPTMVVVPAGTFVMGSPQGKGDAIEHPQHEVTIAKPFAVGKTEVTFAEWDACVAAAACRKASDAGWGRDDRPVINVSWDDAKQYVSWLSRLTGQDYRLLTEAEWEYAARAGNPGRFTFGDDVTQLAEHAWFSENSGSKTQPIAKKRANAFGLHDMHGNVWEWCEDNWHPDYRGAPNDGLVWPGGDASLRVLRGGSWGDDPGDLRSAFRNGDRPGGRVSGVGFRVARTLLPPTP
jgi:formylglycine-generating enzyme required for sulfatase activity